ncbi:sensor histidine kinase [Rhizobium rosettiformans]|uniref:sensor histidine kinase n=1 Tax=Rhizobium rosettiformans TaxID=1368430 RepID=UPI0028570196|nr:cache domain-containing protein [Rhizobium rosettiformans]MDR7031195.1 two-component sensor histidine kinase [Rhizobium rosettiformans]MDR7067061.1 two-component sensor histidine kinase [Rhizobium rosettiformans]
MTTSNSTRSVSKIAAFATAAALVALLSILGTWAAQSYFTAINRAEERAIASVKIVASNASWIHQIGTQTVRRIDDALTLSDLRFDGNIRDMDVATQGLPSGVQAYVVDATGRTLYSTDPQIKPVDISDRDYFRAVRDGKLEYVSSLLISRLSGDQIFVFSRRIVREGQFVGAIMVSVPVGIMRPIWDTVDLGGNYTVSLIRDDGMLVARYPFPETTLDMSGYVLFTKYLKEASSGTYLADASPMDGVKRLVAYQRVDGTPFVAVAATDYSVLIRPFWTTLSMLGAVALLVIGGAIAAGWWILHLLRAQEQQSAQLAKALETNEMLLREIHHRVKNNLQSVMSLVRLQMRGNDGVESLNSRIKSMIAVHEQIYKHDAYSEIDAAELIRAIVCNAVSAHDAKLTVKFELQPQPVSAEKATALALLVNEVVTNAIKYAYPDGSAGRLSVALTKSDEAGKTLLIISDEGVGFDVNAIESGTGTRLVDGSVRQLDGHYEFDTHAGTKFSAKVTLA